MAFRQELGSWGSLRSVAAVPPGVLQLNMAPGVSDIRSLVKESNDTKVEESGAPTHSLLYPLPAEATSEASISATLCFRYQPAGCGQDVLWGRGAMD